LVVSDQVDQLLILLLVLPLQGIHPIDMVMNIVGLVAIQRMHLLEECQALRHVDLPIQKKAMADARIILIVIAVVVIMTMFLDQNVHILQWFVLGAFCYIIVSMVFFVRFFSNIYILFSHCQEEPPRYGEPSTRNSRARLEYGVSASASQYGDYGEPTR